MRPVHGNGTAKVNLLWVGMGGALGAICRYGVSLLLAPWSQAFPWATLLINGAGSLAIGIAFALFADRLEAWHSLRLLVIVGFLGGFTTFSAFSLETYQLLLRGELISAVLYALASVILCVLAVAVGIWMVRLF